MADTIQFGLDDMPELDKPDGTPVKISLEGKIVSRSGNSVEVEVTSKDVQTEKAVDKEYRALTETQGAAEGAGKDEVDW